jgi:hypothetical protein
MNVSPPLSFQFYRNTYLGFFYLICLFPYLVVRFNPHGFSFGPLFLLFISLTLLSIATSSGVCFLRKANVAVRRS